MDNGIHWRVCPWNTAESYGNWELERPKVQPEVIQAKVSMAATLGRGVIVRGRQLGWAAPGNMLSPLNQGHDQWINAA